MTVEDRLRESLRRRADAVPVGDEGWASIQARLDGRARGRRGLAIALAAVLPVGVAVAVLAFALVDAGDDEQSVRIPTATTEQPGPAPSSDRSDDEPWRVARIAPEDDFAGIWPEATPAELAETEESPEQWRVDPVEVGRRYVAERFGVEPEMYPAEVGPDSGQVGFDVPPHERPYSGRVQLAKRAGGCCGVWFVREAQLGHVTVHPVGFSAVGGVVSAGALRDPLVLEANATVAGEATVELLVPGGEEVVDDRTVSLDGRAERRIVMSPPLDVPGLVVRIRMTDAQGRLHRHEFRVNGLREDVTDEATVSCGTAPTEGPEADEMLQEMFGVVLVGTPARREHVVTDRFRPVLAERMADLTTSGYTVDRFTVTGDWYREDGRAAICARVFLARDDRVVATRDDVFELVRDGERWQVDRWFPGVEQPMTATTTVRLFFWEQLDCTEADRMEETTVEIAGEADPQTVLHELFSGPDARADGVGPPNTTALPADARVRFAFVEDGVAIVDVSDATDAGGGACLQSARQEQVERTLLAIPGIDAVQLQVEGREGEPPFQP